MLFAQHRLSLWYEEQHMCALHIYLNITIGLVVGAFIRVDSHAERICSLIKIMRIVAHCLSLPLS